MLATVCLDLIRPWPSTRASESSFERWYEPNLTGRAANSSSVGRRETGQRAGSTVNLARRGSR